jgi:uncharacterized membrane protein
MKNKSTLFLVQAAMIGAIYVVLTVAFAPISFGEVQIRFAEALTILPFFTPAAVPGVIVGCREHGIASFIQPVRHCLYHGVTSLCAPVSRGGACVCYAL